MITKWIPEAKEHPGYYALSSSNIIAGNVAGNTTRNVNEARQFKTKAECQKWCDAQPLAWIPREHSWEA